MVQQTKKRPLKTGYCYDGLHEGTKPKSYSGKPMKTCEFWLTCPCDCHEMITRMFEESGMERILLDNPEYKPVKSPFWMPNPLDKPLDLRPSNGSGPQTRTVIEPAIPGATPARIAASYAPTPSGRSARGELESRVQEACDDWVALNPEDKCTPEYVSEYIAEAYDTTPPSVGAVHSVFMRWQALGFAFVEKKPVRFLGYTPDGVQYGLERLKIKTKREKKLKSAAANRGERR